MIVRVYDKPVTLTPETIAATRQWFIDNAHARIAEAREYVETGGKSGTWVGDLDSYTAGCISDISRTRRGEGDRSLAFVQRAVALQTGECVPLLTPTKSHPHA